MRCYVFLSLIREISVCREMASSVYAGKAEEGLHQSMPKEAMKSKEFVLGRHELVQPGLFEL